MTRRHKQFRGGRRFPTFEGQPVPSLADIGAPERVIVPLLQGFRDAVKPTVAVGDVVAAGQEIGRDDDAICSPVHASVSGVVDEIGKPNQAEGLPGFVAIRSQGAATSPALPGHGADWMNMAVPCIEDLLYSSGVSALGSGGIPTRHRSSVISPDEVEHIIVHAVGGEMYGPSPSFLLDADRLPQFVAGLGILQRAMPAARVHVALDDRETDLAGRLTDALAALEGIELTALAPRYPQNFDELLVPALLGQAFPHGFAAANIGVVSLGFQVVLHAHDAVVHGKPLTATTVALCGPGFQKPGYVRLPIGTPLEDLARQAVAGGSGLRFIQDSTLTGKKLAIPGAVVDRTCEAVIALPELSKEPLLPFVRPGLRDDAYSRTFLACLLPRIERKADAGLKGEDRPCVSCGYCQDVCPVGVIPHLLYKYVAKGFLEDRLVDELRIFDCIGCNLCSYVCPSKIGLGRKIRAGQDMFRNEGIDNSANVQAELKGIDMKIDGEQAGK